MERMMSDNPDITPEMRDMFTRLTTSSGLKVIGMLISVVIYSVFGTLGGLIGAAMFKKNLPPPPPPGTIDVPPSPPMAPPPPPPPPPPPVEV
jgi:hypothetical protein